MSSTEKKYQWEHPLDWIIEKLNETSDPEILRDYARTCASALDSDQLQDLFQSGMDEDGYFEEIEE